MRQPHNQQRSNGSTVSSPVGKRHTLAKQGRCDYRRKCGTWRTGVTHLAPPTPPTPTPGNSPIRSENKARIDANGNPTTARKQHSYACWNARIHQSLPWAMPLPNHLAGPADNQPERQEQQVGREPGAQAQRERGDRATGWGGAGEVLVRTLIACRTARRALPVCSSLMYHPKGGGVEESD